MTRTALAILALLLLGTLPGLGAGLSPTSCAANGCTLTEPGSTTYVLNNLWGADKATGSQSVTIKSPTAWSTTASWNRPDDWQVTSYASAILGWHWGWVLPRALTGLPVAVSGPAKVLTESAFTITPQGATPFRYDMAYDLWLHPTADPKPDGSDPRTELMVWLSYSQDYLWQDPSHPVVARPTLGGRPWKVFLDDKVLAFVVDGANLTSVSLDLMEFVRWVVANRPDLVPAGYWLTSVQFGPEIYKGAGTVDVTRYAVRVQ